MSNVIRKAEKRIEKKNKELHWVEKTLIGLAVGVPWILVICLVANPLAVVKVNNFVRGKDYFTLYAEGDRLISEKISYNVDDLVTLNSDYSLKNLGLEGDYEVTMSKVNDRIDEKLSSYTLSEDLPDGFEVNYGDIVNVDFAGYQEGDLVDNTSAENTEITLGSGGFVDGFEENIAGHNVGDTFEFDITFPEDYEGLAGQTVTFKCTINSAKVDIKKDHSNTDDDFIKTNFDGFETYQEFYDATWNEVKEELESSENDEKRYRVLEAVKAVAEINIPEDLMKKEIYVYQQQYEHMYVNDDSTLATYLKENYDMTVTEFRDEVAGDVEDSLKNVLVCEKLAKILNITTTDEDIANYLVELAEDSTFPANESLYELYDTDYMSGKDYVARMCLCQKVVNELEKEATFVAVEADDDLE